MTSLLSGPARAARTAPEPPTDVAHRRPLVLLALLGGVAAAAGPLVVCLGVGVAGWFLSDAGAHGAPRDGLRAGAYAWLMGHGSGLTVAGVTVSAIPLGITFICAWAVWRIAHRVGDSISGHGPDADAIADGVRDWTVPAATALFTAGYVAVAVVTLRVLTADSVPVSGSRVVVWSLLLCLVVGGASIAIGAGRAAIWTAFLPLSVRAAATVCLKVVTTLLLVSAAVFLVALVVDLGAALNVMSELHSDVGEASLYAGLALVVLPNAVLFAASYLLGPGFAVGTATVASPTAVVLGPVPAFPLLAALPDDGAPSSWMALLLLVPPVVAAYAAARVHRLYPTTRWEEAAVRGCAGGILAGLVVVALAVDLGAALNVMSELHSDVGEASLYAGLALVVLPNAALCAGSYLLGPGFAVGTATIASPTAVVLGPVPAFPLLAALPDDGAPSSWMALLLLVPPVVAAYAAARVHRLYPTTRWEEGAVRGCAGGILAGLVVGGLSALAGGSVGPGRMQDVGPFAAQVTLHAVVALGLGALVGSLLATWSYRRYVRRQAAL